MKVKLTIEVPDSTLWDLIDAYFEMLSCDDQDSYSEDPELLWGFLREDYENHKIDGKITEESEDG